MFTLPPSLAVLGGYRQFIIYQLTPSSSRPGRNEKYPLNWRTVKPHNAHDPAIWLDVETAAAKASSLGEGYGVGFVFTLDDPFWFLDIDDCREDDAAGNFLKWSDTACELFNQFSGCAVEVSSSKRGLHFIGTGKSPGPHKTRYGKCFELYTEGRFVALTGASATGDAASVHDAALAALVKTYLTPGASIPVEWSNGPCEGWSGPVDDNQLIDRAMRHVSGREALGGIRRLCRPVYS